jgi:hypothetical protein
MEYRRLWQPGGTYFFTVNLLRRRNNDLLTRHIDMIARGGGKCPPTSSFRYPWLGGIAGPFALPD